ncbi:MAG: GGDEF domain-containing protein [Lachnospiraceae bacterium]|nr:GGDEF domain-containing protein [Lachnospiraceae bacterium]
MAKKSEKNYRKLKKNHSWISFILFGILVWFVGGFVQFFVNNFADYLLDSKLSSEYETITYMAKLYSEGLKNGDDNIHDLLDASGRPYIIKDEQGNIVFERGRNTCSEENGKVLLYLFSDPIVIYTDTDQRILYPKENGSLEIDKNKLSSLFVSAMSNPEDYQEYFVNPEIMNNTLWNSIGTNYSEMTDEEMEDLLLQMREDGVEDIDVESFMDAYQRGYEIGQGLAEYENTGGDAGDSTVEAIQDTDDGTADGNDNSGDLVVYNNDLVGITFDSGFMNQFIQLPVWMSAELEDGGYLIAKAYYRIGMKDLVIIGILGVVIVLLILFVLIVMLVNAINSFNSQRKMMNVFFTDVVTRGHNWMYFQIKGEQLLRKRSSAKYNYAVLNLFFVKYSNFCVCHSIEEGEQALCKISNLLNRFVEKKEMAAHVSTSNYALILRYVNEDELKMRIQRILAQLEKIDSDHKFGFHVGVDLLPANADENGSVTRRKNLDIEQEYNNACAARATLSDSDDSGIAFFDTKLVEEQKWIDIVQEQQKKALENEEFLVYYQPKYDPRTNELRGAEALIRWDSPEYGFITPGRFIPIFEKNGFITEIDHYMIRHVARDQKAWLDQGYTCVPVSVNVSRAHFIESDLAEQIRDMLDEVGCPHDIVEIELTESAFFDDKKAMINTISKLKRYGFAVSMDDFGSGYSSLNSLKDMPLDVLKLDAEFFRGESEDGRGEIVVTEAIKLAKSLNMRTVAEGVEVKEQVDFLAEQGCDMIQGYYFSKPVPKDEYQEKMSM